MKRLCVLVALFFFGISSFAVAQVRVSGKVQIEHMRGGSRQKGNADVVAALIPMGEAPALDTSKHYRLTQHDKSFESHLLVIPVGAIVDFPNHDPMFHNVFSMFEGQRFDLGLYEAGSNRSVRFAKAGVSYIFCNIHPEMEAIVVAVPTQLFAVTKKSGEFAIADVPPGRYRLTFWYERSTSEDLAKLTREIQVDADVALSSVAIPETVAVPTQHKNKYGLDYDVSNPNSPYSPGQ